MTAETFYPYSFNGGGEYDGYDDFQDAAAPPVGDPEEDAAEDEEDLKKLFSKITTEYVNTGNVTDPENAILFRQVFPELDLPEPKQTSFATIGAAGARAAPAASDVTGVTGGQQVGGQRVRTFAEINGLRSSVRIPEKSVVPVKNVIGGVMKEFLDEVEKNIPSLREDRRVGDSVRRAEGNIVREINHLKRRLDDNNDAQNAAQSPASDMENARLQATTKKHAPWIRRQKYIKIEPSGERKPPDHDLSISRKVFSKYVRAWRADRIATAMKEHDRTELVTLILESESDVWMACEGRTDMFPEDMWITKRTVRPCPCEDVAAEQGSRDLRENFRDFLEGTEGPGFVTERATLESQLYDYFKARDRATAVKKTKDMVSAFYAWVQEKEFSTRDVTVTSILREGGDTTNQVAEHADRLVTLAILDGYVTENAGNAAEQLLYLNEVPTFKKFTLQRSTAVEASSRAVDGTTDAQIVEYFRKGKESIIAKLADSIGCDKGGPNAKLIIDLEYRTHFIRLCRANYLLKMFDHDSRVVTDRRKRILDQERVKRECLHFFQSKIGMGSRINSDFVRHR